ncbi:hypothetical protein B9Q08_02260 [Candidatus Marsarchaeota G2 archaeon ECH_B_SAG-M15]|uniref:Uncharacterized protein n=1 Tax=Candidatus Marsarchaeota G2 archaeon ECH_B_SAG-M15 TaxID=1978162 RepID=A0A2R6AZN0_9ARCH|nr:MAG: hypothetical protein B9Q08_02260 [Candidatus Marsarchaeota G2 archaeon ECH_B_SAG-M15]
METPGNVSETLGNTLDAFPSLMETPGNAWKHPETFPETSGNTQETMGNTWKRFQKHQETAFGNAQKQRKHSGNTLETLWMRFPH